MGNWFHRQKGYNKKEASQLAAQLAVEKTGFVRRLSITI
jgi:hypothetical protein